MLYRVVVKLGLWNSRVHAEAQRRRGGYAILVRKSSEKMRIEKQPVARRGAKTQG